jgi:prevent-host-death family protein
MNVTNIHEAKTHFSQLVERVQSGEEIVIGKAGKPVAKLVPFEQPKAKTGQRKLGCWKGKVRIADDFDDLPEDIAKAFGMID